MSLTHAQSQSSQTQQGQMCVDPSLQQSGPGNQALQSQMNGTPASQELAGQQQAVQNLGDVDSFGESLYSALGGCVDALVPDVGDQSNAKLRVNVPVGGNPNVRIGLRIDAGAERSGNGVKLSGSIMGTFTGQVETWLLDAWVQARAGGYLEAQGDSGAECFRLMILAMQRRVASISQDAADYVFDGESIQRTINGMDDNDYVESGFAAGVNAGAGSADNNASVDLSGTTGTRLSSNGRGGVQQQGTTSVQGAIKVKADPFEVEGQARFQWIEGALDEVKASMSGTHETSMEDLTLMVGGANYVTGLIGDLGDVISGQSGLAGNDTTAARQVGSLVGFIHNNSTLGLGVPAASQAALQNLSRFNGVTIAHKLTVEGGWSASDGYGLGVKLERLQKVQFGNNDRDLIYAELENVQQVFEVST
jgi:hypothetical protein